MKLFTALVFALVSTLALAGNITRVTVTGYGPTEIEAREDAFRIAIEQVVGTHVQTDLRVSDYELAKRDIINYSSGYVQGYKVLNIANSAQGLAMTVTVDVMSSKIGERLFAKSTTEGEADGQVGADGINSYRNQQETGDRYVDAVLRDFPERAFAFTNTTAAFVTNTNRSSGIQIEYTINWDPRYMTALEEAVRDTSEPAKRSFWCVEDCRPRNTLGTYITFATDGALAGYREGVEHFVDAVRFNMFKNRMVFTNPHVLVQLQSINGQTVFEQCIDYLGDRYVRSGADRVAFNVDFKERRVATIDLGTTPLEQITNYVVTVVEQSRCN